MNRFRLPMVAFVCGAGLCASATADDRPASEAAPPESAARAFSADAAVEWAVLHNPFIAAAEAEVDASEAELFQAWARYIPTFKVEALFTWVPSAKGDALNGYLDYGTWGPLVRTNVDGEVTLYAFGQLAAIRDSARAGVDVSKARRRVAEAELSFLTRKAYYGWLYAVEAGAVMDEGQKYIDRARRRLEELEESESPDFDPVDLMKLRVQEATALEGRAEVARGLAVAREGLKAVLALPADVLLELTDPLEPLAVEIQPVAKYVALAMESRPEMAVARGQLAKKQAGADRRFAEFFPKLGIKGFYDFAYSPVAEDQRSPFANDPFNISVGGVGINVRWTFDLGQQLGRYDEANAEMARALSELEALMLKVRADVADAHAELERQHQLIGVQERAMKAARGWLIAKSDLYDAGFGTIDDVSSALVEFYKRRLGHIQAKFHFNLAVAKMTRVVGVDIRLVLSETQGPARK